MAQHRQFLRWSAAVAAIVLFVVIGGVIFVATLDWNRAKPYIANAVSKASGREFVIDGNLAVDLGWNTKLRASGLKLQNASWSKVPLMFDIGQLDAEIDVRQLLKGRLTLPLVALSQVKLFLEKNDQGAVNWELGAPTPVADAIVPKRRTRVPVVETLLLKDAVLIFDNQETRAHFEVQLAEAEARGFWQAPVVLKARGSYQRLPMTVSFNGGSYEKLRNARELYPLQLDLSAGNLEVKIRGNFIEPLAMKGENVTLDIQGDNMANLFPLIRLVFPQTPPYRLTGHLSHEGNVWTFSKFAGRVGDSDLAGEIRVDTGAERPLLKANLTSNKLDFKDLAGFIGGNPGNKPKDDPAKPEDQRIFPDQRYDLQRLNAMDAQVTLRARQILAPGLPIDDLNAGLTLSKGVLRFTPAAFGVANGRIEIFSTFDGSAKTPRVNIDARLRRLDLRRFLGPSSFAEQTLGPIGGRIVLAGSGHSFRELMATASGKTFIVFGSGEISDLLVRLVGLNVARALGVLIRGDKPIPIRCGLVELAGKDGVMAIQTMAFDTATTVINGEGKIDLRDESVDVLVLPVPKDFSPFSLRSYIRVNGRFKNISAFPDPIKTGTQSVFKKIFNVLALLFTSPLQPRDLGQGRDLNCPALMAKVEAQDSAKVVPKVEPRKG